MPSDWIGTGEAMRIITWIKSSRTFRDAFVEVIQFRLTPGGHYRWLRGEVEAQASHGLNGKNGQNR